MKDYDAFIIKESGRIIKYQDGIDCKFKKTDAILVVFFRRNTDKCEFGIISRRYPFSNVLIPEVDKENWNYSVPTLKQWESFFKLYQSFKKEGK